MECIITAFVLVFLGIESIADYRKKTILLYPSVIMITAAAVCNIVSGRMNVQEMAAGCLTGAAIILTGIISKQRIGLGDGVILLVIGMWSGGIVSFMTLVLGSTAASVIMLMFLLSGRIKKGQQIPFVPFLLIGFEGVILFV